MDQRQSPTNQTGINRQINKRARAEASILNKGVKPERQKQHAVINADKCASNEEMKSQSQSQANTVIPKDQPTRQHLQKTEQGVIGSRQQGNKCVQHTERKKAK